MSDPNEPRQPPRPPRFTPLDPTAEYPLTSQFPQADYDPPRQPADYGAYPPPHGPTGGHPPQDPAAGYPPPYDPASGQPPAYDPGYPPQGPPPPGYGPPQGPPRKSKAPLVFVVLIVSLLLCGGVVMAGKILVDRATAKAEEIAGPILNPTQALPTEGPDLPDLPGLPTGFPDLPGLPTDLPTDLPGFGQGAEITVTYEVTGDGPAEVVYTEPGNTPKRAGNVKLPWKITTKMKSPALVSVIALRTGLDSGGISCRVTVNGKQVAEQTAEGRLSSANCYNVATE